MTIAPPSPIGPASAHVSRRERDEPNARLAAVVLLAGTVRQTELARAAGRARVDLPITGDLTLGDCWSRRIGELREATNSPELPMIVAANTIARPPRDAGRWPKALVCMDSEEPRGSGGALRDAVQGLNPDAYVLIVPGHAFPRESLTPVLQVLTTAGADAVVHADAGNAPTGIFLIRCAALAALSGKGFMDLKEQALPQIASRAEVRVVRTDHVPPMAIRTLDGYIAALRVAAGAGSLDGTMLEDWRCTFSIAEPGADVHSTARLHDTVVLDGGRVGAGAVVVRSVVGPGGVVRAGDAVFDEMIGSGSRPA